MTPADRTELDRVDRKRRREEAMLLALLLLFLDRARTAVPHALRFGVDPAQAAAEVIGGGGVHQPGIVSRLAVRMANTHVEAFKAVTRGTAPKPDLKEVARQYRPVAVDVADRLAGNVRRLVDTVLGNVRAADVPATINRIIVTMRETFDARGYSPKSPASAQAVAVTLAAQAWSAGSFAAWQHPDIWATITGFEFVTFRDERVCPVCEPRDGVKLPRDDPWWMSNYPPLHFRCRCNVWPIARDFKDKPPPDSLPVAGANFGLRPDLRIGYSFAGTK